MCLQDELQRNIWVAGLQALAEGRDPEQKEDPVEEAAVYHGPRIPDYHGRDPVCILACWRLSKPDCVYIGGRRLL